MFSYFLLSYYKHLSSPRSSLYIYLILSFLFAPSCFSPSSRQKQKKTYLYSRPEFVDGDSKRFLLYSFAIDEKWMMKENDLTEDLSDTKIPLAQFALEDTLTCFFYSFPSNKIDERIPAHLFCERWKQQLGQETIHTSYNSTKFGFTMTFFEGESHDESAMMAVVYALSPFHYRNLEGGKSPYDRAFRRQMRSDLIFKVAGSKLALKKHRKQILQLWQSFELTKELPLESL